jgi:SAM-dependent methyltransferase
MFEIQSIVDSIDWNAEGADTKYLTHSIHRYSGKFIPQIAAEAIELLTEPDDLVLDPFCGSGTTLLEAAVRRRRSIGVDLNPVATLVARVKTTPVDARALRSLEQQFADLMPTRDYGTLWDRVQPDFRETTQPPSAWQAKWFAPRALEELVHTKRIIDALDDPAIQAIALVAFSDILRRSSNAHQGYPNLMFDKHRGDPPSPIALFKRRLRSVVSAVAILPYDVTSAYVPSVILGQAQHIPLADCSVDAVITHPPYVGSIPYAEYHELSLRWLGHDPKEVDRSLTGGLRQRPDVLERYERDMAAILEETWRVLRDGGKLFMLLGRPTVRGRAIDLPAIATDLASEANLTPIATGRRRGSNRRANKMTEEILLVFEKQSRPHAGRLRASTAPAA